jgi:hypothetical protein
MKRFRISFRSLFLFLWSAFVWGPVLALPPVPDINFVPFQQGQKWGYKNPLGGVVIPPKYDSAGPFYEGLAGVEVGNLWGFIDEKGVMVIRPSFGGYFGDLRFSEGRCQVDGGYIDKTGKNILKPGLRATGNFSDGLAPVIDNQTQKWGYVNPRGNLAIPCQYEEGADFSDGLACVKVGGKYGIIDTRGKTVIAPQFDNRVGYYGDAMSFYDSKKGMIYFDTAGKQITEDQFKVITENSPEEKLTQKSLLQQQAVAQGKHVQDFDKQNQKDELYQFTANSYLDPDYQPLAGEPVLLAAQIKPWDLSQGTNFGKNQVRFEVVSGNALLAAFADYSSTDPAALTDSALSSREKQSLTVTADTSTSVLVWLFTQPGRTEAVTVKAELLKEGDRGAYVGGHSEDSFVVQPVLLPKDWDLSVNSLAEAQAQKEAGHRVVLSDTETYDATQDPPVLVSKSHTFVRGGKLMWSYQPYSKAAPQGTPTEKENPLNPPATHDEALASDLKYYQAVKFTHINLKTNQCVGLHVQTDKNRQNAFINVIDLQKAPAPGVKIVFVSERENEVSRMVFIQRDFQEIDGQFYPAASENEYFDSLASSTPRSDRIMKQTHLSLELSK